MQMDLMGRTLVLSLGAALALATPAVGEGAGTGFVIAASGPRAEHRIGADRVARDPGRSYPAAVKAVGLPSARAPGGAGSCTAHWQGLGLAMTFSSPGPAPCSPSRLSRSVWFGATASGDRWRTDR